MRNTCWKHSRELNSNGDCSECGGKPPERNVYDVRIYAALRVKAESDGGVEQAIEDELMGKDMTLLTYVVRRKNGNEVKQ